MVSDSIASHPRHNRTSRSLGQAAQTDPAGKSLTAQRLASAQHAEINAAPPRRLLGARIRRLADVATSVEEIVRRLPDGDAINPAKQQLAAAAAELRLAVDRLAADPAAARASPKTAKAPRAKVSMAAIRLVALRSFCSSPSRHI